MENPIAAEHKLEQTIVQLLSKGDDMSFLVGRDGEFDILAASVIRRCCRELQKDNIELVWVLPYMTKDCQKHEEEYLKYYDRIEIAQKSFGAHFKAAIQLRNYEMVDRSDLVIFCVEHRSGGAYQTLCYAQKTGVEYIDLLNFG